MVNKGRKKGAPRVGRISNVVKPQNMSTEDWQRSLRRQIAEKESFVIHESRGADRPGYYSVKKTIYRKPSFSELLQGMSKKPAGYSDEHEIVYRGEMSPWNYCSCLDFKTSGLGTCKHIEAVKLWINRNGKKVESALPAVSSVYVDYTDARSIKLRIGSEAATEVYKLASRYFDEECTLRRGAEDSIYQFLEEARGLGLPVRCFPDVIDLAKERTNLKQVKKLSAQITDELLSQLVKEPLYPYQKEGIAFAFRHGRSIIADEMGLGKTVQAIGVAELLRHFRLITSVLIVCPTSLKYQWKHEIEKFTGSSAVVVEGNALKRKEIYQSDSSFYKIVSYQAMSNDVRLQGSISVDMLIMDEVQRLKNWDTKIAKAARRIKSDFAVVLSGTPLENKLEELYSIVELIDQYFLSPYYRFREECIVTDDTGMTVGYKNLNVVGEKLKEIMIRRKKCEVALQMPDRMDQTIYVPMTKEQADIHAELQSVVSQIVNKWRRYHFLSELDRQRLLLMLNKMRMVANSTYILDQHTRFDTKIDELMHILEDVFSSGDEKVVIFSTWERMTRIVATELDSMGIKYSNLNGSVPSHKRKQLVDAFNTDPECRVFISTDAGATGLNLQAGSIIINMELPWNPAVHEQRIGRIFRLGQHRNVQVINFVSLNSIERDIESKISFKSAMSEGILDDGYDEIFVKDKSKIEEIISVIGDGLVHEEVDSQVVSVTHAESLVNAEPDASDNDASEAAATGADAASAIATSAAVEVDDDFDDLEVIHIVDIDPDDTNDASAAPDLLLQPAPDQAGGSRGEVASTSGSQSGASPSELVQQGVSFLSGLAQTLRSPERTRQLVDTLVKTDEATGQTTLQIPVPDKEAVTGFLSMLGSLLK